MSATWPDRRLIDLLEIDLPIVQAPMAGAGGADLAVAACSAGALGSLPCAMLDADSARAEIGVIRQRMQRPLNLNFFCHQPPAANAADIERWQAALSGYYVEHGLDPNATAPAANRAPFDDAMCDIVEQYRPQVVSFHFGLPAPPLLARVKAAGCKILSSATSVAEARWLETQGVHAIIAQGFEAGGHQGMFLDTEVARRTGTMALVPQIVDAVAVPVIAAGGIGDGRGIAAAFMLGAAGVQLGTAYLHSAESTISQLHREALAAATESDTALSNVFSGRPARGIFNRLMREQGPIAEAAPAFPTAAGPLAPLKSAAERRGSADFSSLWAGQAVALGQAAGPDASAAELTRKLAEGALDRLGR